MEGQQPSTSRSSDASASDSAAAVPNDPQPSTSDAVVAAAIPVINIDNLYGDFVPRNLYSLEVAAMYNLPKLVRELGTREQCINFAIEMGLLPATKLCRIHRKPMNVELWTNATVGSFVCNKGNCRARPKIPRGKGTWFEDVHITLPHTFYLMYAFAHRWNYEQTILEDLAREGDKCLSRATIADWFSYCREVIVIYQLEQEQVREKIGGPGKVVQIGESKFGKRKYSKGRRIEGRWVLGIIEDGSEDLRLEVCPENIQSAEVLVPIIKKHVVEGTTIHTDYWRAYDCLEQHGYIHKKVNHSDPDNPFVAPDGTHTQRIDSQWRIVKKFFYKENYNHTMNFGDVIVEYLWRREICRNKRDPFLELITAIKNVYKF